MRTVLLSAVIFLALGVGAAAAYGSEDIVVHGLVVDEGRHPQQGVRIEVRHDGSLSRGVTDAEGRYYVSIRRHAEPRTGMIAVSARSRNAKGALGGWTRVSLGAGLGGRVRAPMITLTALHPHTVTILGPDGPAEGVELMLTTGSRYSRTSLRPIRSGAGGQVALQMPKGDYALVVTDPRWEAWERAFTLPPTAEANSIPGYDTRRLSLPRARSLRVRVLDDDTGTPLEGASVRRVKAGRGYGGVTISTPTVVTDVNGEATLPRLPAGASFHVGAWFSAPRSRVKAEVAAEQDEVELRLLRPPLFTARWPVAATPHRPVSGEAIVLRPNRHDKGKDRAARIEDDEVVLEHYSDTSDYFFAVHEEKTAARLYYELVRDETDSLVKESVPARFLPTSTVRVRLVDESGAPLVGWRVDVDGWYTIRDEAGRLTRTSMVRGDPTDEAGEIVWEGVFFEPCRLKILRGPGHAVERPLGEIDPRPGDSQVYEYVVPRPRMVELHVTLDGRPGLRNDIDVYCSGHLSAFDADPTTGIIRFPYLPDGEGKSASLRVSAGGYVSWSESIASEQEGALRYEVKLKTSLTLSVVLVPEPTEHVLGDVVQVQRFDEERERWVLEGDCGYTPGSWFSEGYVTSKGLPCWRALRGLTPGLYRLVHVPTGVAAASFAIDPSKPIWVTKYSLPEARSVKGRFTAGVEIPWSEALIEDVGGAPGLRWESDLPERSEFRTRGSVQKDGRFDIKIAAGEAVRLRLSHPLLEPCLFEVPVRLSKPLVVPVTPRIILEIPCPHSPTKLPEGLSVGSGSSGLLEFFTSLRSPPSWVIGLRHRAHLTQDAPRIWAAGTDEQGARIWTALERVYDRKTQTIRVGFTEAGRRTLFVDFDDRAPFVLKDLLVPDQGLALGRVPASRGSRVHVKIVPSLRNGMRWVTVHATPEVLTGPAWSRQSTLEGRMVNDRDPWDDRRVKPGGLTTVYGLRRGTYRLRVNVGRDHTVLDGAPEHVEVGVTVDGKTDVTITADFRTPAERALAKKQEAASPPR